MRKTYSLIAAAALLAGHAAGAADVNELRNKMQDHSSQIQRLELEIKQYQQSLDAAKRQGNTLKSEITKMELTRKKLLGDLELTRKKMSATELTIQELSHEIGDRQTRIERNTEALAESLRLLNAAKETTLLEVALGLDSFSALADKTESLSKIQEEIVRHTNDLRENKVVLSDRKTGAEKAKVELTSLQARLADQKVLVEQSKSEKDKLLSQTRNQEAGYQKLLTDTLAKKKQVEAEIQKIEEEIRIAIDPNRLPTSGSGALQWPLDKVTITQYFGNTEFATKNPQLYSGAGHNGIDLAAPVGTTLKAAAAGKVIGVGDTDQTCSRASYGKWVLIEHPNGLTTLYAHLSLIKVSEGQAVGAGETIGYTGNTGYSTGPHLHFTVYASQGVKVGSLQSKVPGCGVYRLPIAGYNSYLNPLSYLQP